MRAPGLGVPRGRVILMVARAVGGICWSRGDELVIRRDIREPNAWEEQWVCFSEVAGFDLDVFWGTWASVRVSAESCMADVVAWGRSTSMVLAVSSASTEGAGFDAVVCGSA